MIVKKWDDYFFDLIEVLKERSKDAETKVGCVIIDNNHNIVSTGYNSFPRNCKDDELPNAGPEKYNYIVHAEMNALISAKRDLSGCSLYCNLSPCINCTKLIITSNITNVYFKKKYKDFEETMKLWSICGYQLEEHNCYYLLRK